MKTRAAIAHNARLLMSCDHAFARAFARAAKKALIAFSLRSTLCARSNARPHFAFVTPHASSTRAALNFTSLAFVVVALRLLDASCLAVACLSSVERLRVALARAVVDALVVTRAFARFVICFVIVISLSR